MDAAAFARAHAAQPIVFDVVGSTGFDNLTKGEANQLIDDLQHSRPVWIRVQNAVVADVILDDGRLRCQLTDGEYAASAAIDSWSKRAAARLDPKQLEGVWESTAATRNRHRLYIRVKGDRAVGTHVGVLAQAQEGGFPGLPFVEGGTEPAGAPVDFDVWEGELTLTEDGSVQYVKSSKFHITPVARDGQTLLLVGERPGTGADFVQIDGTPDLPLLLGKWTATERIRESTGATYTCEAEIYVFSCAGNTLRGWLRLVEKDSGGLQTRFHSRGWLLRFPGAAQSTEGLIVRAGGVSVVLRTDLKSGRGNGELEYVRRETDADFAMFDRKPSRQRGFRVSFVRQDNKDVLRVLGEVIEASAHAGSKEPSASSGKSDFYEVEAEPARTLQGIWHWNEGPLKRRITVLVDERAGTIDGSSFDYWYFAGNREPKQTALPVTPIRGPEGRPDRLTRVSGSLTEKGDAARALGQLRHRGTSYRLRCRRIEGKPVVELQDSRDPGGKVIQLDREEGEAESLPALFGEWQGSAMRDGFREDQMSLYVVRREGSKLQGWLVAWATDWRQKPSDVKELAGVSELLEIRKEPAKDLVLCAPWAIESRGDDNAIVLSELQVRLNADGHLEGKMKSGARVLFKRRKE